MWLEALKLMKKNSGKTNKHISEESGVPLGTVNKLFAGQTRDPKIDTLSAIVHCLGYTLDDLYPDSQKQKTPAPEESEAGDKVSMEELTAFLTKAGYIEDGGDLSDSDFEFLAHLVGLLDLWCKSR